MGHPRRLQLPVRIEPRPIDEVGDRALVWVVLQPRPDPVGVQVGLTSARKVQDEAARRGLVCALPHAAPSPVVGLILSDCDGCRAVPSYLRWWHA